VERWARLRTVAARDFRMFFFADAIFGTKTLSRKIGGAPDGRTARPRASAGHAKP
jgi:hypothetical protein